tara:strand:- start:8019 stop:9650 length:1632 start_codon:yes stop_codon:yes gene_type:complete
MENKKIQTYTAPSSGRKDFVRLDFSENTQGCSEKVVEAIRKLNKEDLGIYPDYTGFADKIAQYCKVKQENILPTNGCDAALKLIIDCFVEKDDSAITVEPTFGIYKFFLGLKQAKIISILCKPDLKFPLETVLSSIDEKTKLIILCNPNNPTGTLILRQDIIAILEGAQNAKVLVDEAYFEFSGMTVSDLVGTYQNLIVTRTFSKAFGLAALRVGYIISNGATIKQLRENYAPFEISTLSQIATESALGDISYVEKYVKEVDAGRIRLRSELKNLGVKTWESSGNFVLAWFRDSNRVYQLLKDKKILVRDRSDYPLLKNCLRISLGTITETNLIIDALKEILKPLLIFDLDGVLVDVSKSYSVAIMKTVEFFTGSSIDYEDIQNYKVKIGFNNDWDITEDIIKSKGKVVKKEVIVQKFQSYYIGDAFDGLIRNEKWLLDKGILDTLSQKYTLAIVTGRPRNEAEYVLRNNKVLEYFSEIITLDDVSADKPCPEGIMIVMNRLSAVNAVYFGDTKNDELAARRANIDFNCISNNINEKVRGFLP